MRPPWQVLRDACELAAIMRGFRASQAGDASRDRRLAGKPRIRARRAAK